MSLVKKPKNIKISDKKWEELLEDWNNPELRVKEVAKKVGWAKSTLQDRMSALGLVRPKRSYASNGVVDTSDSVVCVNKQTADQREAQFRELLTAKIQEIPKIKYPVKAPSKIKHSGDEEVQVGLFSDSHAGIKTATFNSDILRERIRKYGTSLVKIAELHRNAYPIRKLVLMFTGDLVHGERVGKQVNLDEFEMPAHNQILDVFVPSVCELLVNLLPYYETIEVHAVEGNHGWPGGKESGYGTNWDVFAMELVKAKMAQFDRVSFEIEREAFYKIVEVSGHNFLMMHGDQIPMHMTLPFYGLTTRALRLRGAIEVKDDLVRAVLEQVKKNNIPIDEAVRKLSSLPFRYVCCGHFHTRADIIFNDVEIFCNGTFSTGDQYPLKKMGMAGCPEQWTFGVHPQRVTWRYPLQLG